MADEVVLRSRVLNTDAKKFHESIFKSLSESIFKGLRFFLFHCGAWSHLNKMVYCKFNSVIVGIYIECRSMRESVVPWTS